MPITPDASDDRLARAAREGDARALADLYRRHAGPLLDYLVSMVEDRSDAEDILQETFLKLFEGRGGYDGRGRFRSWLFTVGVHLARDRTRQARNRRRLLGTFGRETSPAFPADQSRETENAELVRHIENALADLPPTYAEAFRLRLTAGLTYAEMSAIDGEPEGTLRSRVHHALRRIRQRLKQDSKQDRFPERKPAVSCSGGLS